MNFTSEQEFQIALEFAKGTLTPETGIKEFRKCIEDTISFLRAKPEEIQTFDYPPNKRNADEEIM